MNNGGKVVGLGHCSVIGDKIETESELSGLEKGKQLAPIVSGCVDSIGSSAIRLHKIEPQIDG